MTESLLDRTPASSFNLVIEGHPQGKDRPRFRVIAGKGRRPFAQVYTTKKTQDAEKHVQAAWDAAARPYVEGPLTVDLVLYVARPKGHFTSKGTLSAEGLRHRFPTVKPDVDNVLKLILDALNGRAYRDDVDVVAATMRRVWAADGHEMTTVKVATWGA